MGDAAQWPAKTGRIRPVVRDGILVAVELQGFLARQDLLDDGDVFLGPLHRLAEADAVPALDHLRPGRADAAQMNRLPDNACNDSTVIAAQAGVRAGICMMPVPALILVVRARIQAAGDTASVL